MKCFLLYSLVLCFFGYGLASSENAEKSYRTNDYLKAIDLWKKEMQRSDNNLEFICGHLGNSYYKLGDYALASVYYEKALKYNYNQPEILFNLKVVRTKLRLSIVDLESGYWTKLKKAVCFVSIRFYKWILIIFSWVVFGIHICMKPYSFRYRKILMNSLIGLILICTFILAFRIRLEMDNSHGIIVKKGLVGFQNINNSGISFSLKYGEKVELVEKIGEKIQVKNSSGGKWWIQNSDYAEI